MPQHVTLCRYRYDPLDRLASRTPLAAAIARRFYKVDMLATEVQGDEHRSFLRYERQWLACETSSTALLTSDRQHSVLSASVAPNSVHMAYTPYGHRERLTSLPGFNGELPDPVTGHYLLGNGYRAYSPILMRFNSPDSVSPFGKGALNAYGYCAGDPVNRSDASGHEWFDTMLSAAYIALGLGTTGLGVAVARPSLKAVFKGVKVKGPVVDASLPLPQLRRPANESEKLSAAIAVGAVTAGAFWGAAFVAKNVAPDLPLLQVPLAGIAVILSGSTFALRWRSYRLARRAKPVAAPAVAAPEQRTFATQTDEYPDSKSLSIRDIEVTRL